MTETKSTGFVFLASYYEALQELDAETQLKVYSAIMEYALKGNELELKGRHHTIQNRHQNQIL